MLVDTHCHLNFNPLLGDIGGVLERAAAASVHRIVVPAYNNASFDTIRQLAANPPVHPAYGLHPWVAAESLTPDELETWLKDGHAVAVGEIGLDFKIDSFDAARQIDVCRMQLELAFELNLPVILHCRGAFEELLALLSPFGGKLRGVVHAWSRSPELAGRFIREGLHFGLGGAITRPEARNARKTAAYLPLNRIVLETDAPSIGLAGVPPVKTEPYHIATICRELAQLRNISFEEAACATTENAFSLFRLT